MKPIELVEVRPGEWSTRSQPRRNWPLLLSVHAVGLTLVLLLEHWLRG